jgi:hypothetical protein
MYQDDAHRTYQASEGRGMHGKEFVSVLCALGFTTKAIIEAVREMFGVPQGAARLFVDSHPAFVALTTDDVFNGAALRLRCSGASTPRSKYSRRPCFNSGE